MSDAGLLNKADQRGYYQITEFGQRYLDGEVTKDELEEVDPTE